MVNVRRFGSRSRRHCAFSHVAFTLWFILCFTRNNVNGILTLLISNYYCLLITNVNGILTLLISNYYCLLITNVNGILTLSISNYYCLLITNVNGILTLLISSATRNDSLCMTGPVTHHTSGGSSPKDYPVTIKYEYIVSWKLRVVGSRVRCHIVIFKYCTDHLYLKCTLRLIYFW